MHKLEIDCEDTKHTRIQNSNENYNALTEYKII